MIGNNFESFLKSLSKHDMLNKNVTIVVCAEMYMRLGMVGGVLQVIRIVGHTPEWSLTPCGSGVVGRKEVIPLIVGF